MSHGAASPPSQTLRVKVGAPAARAVALKTAGAKPLALACSVCVPAALPRVHRPAPARPVLSLTALAFCTLPPPAVTVKLTTTPTSGTPAASRTRTVGTTATALPVVALWPSLPAG